MFDFVFSPVAFFRRRLQRPPNWRLAALPLCLCAAAQILAGLIFAKKLQPLFGDLMGPSTAVTAHGAPLEILSYIVVPAAYLISFAMATLALISLDVLITDSGRGTRLAEFAGLCVFAELPYALAMVGIALLWSPDRLDALSSLSVRGMLDRQQVMVAGSEFLSTGRILSYYSMIWFVALLTAALKATTDMPTRTLVYSCAFLMLVFVGIRGLGLVLGI